MFMISNVSERTNISISKQKISKVTFGQILAKVDEYVCRFWFRSNRFDEKTIRSQITVDFTNMNK